MFNPVKFFQRNRKSKLLKEILDKNYEYVSNQLSAESKKFKKQSFTR